MRAQSKLLSVFKICSGLYHKNYSGPFQTEASSTFHIVFVFLFQKVLLQTSASSISRQGRVAVHCKYLNSSHNFNMVRPHKVSAEYMEELTSPEVMKVIFKVMWEKKKFLLLKWRTKLKSCGFFSSLFTKNRRKDHSIYSIFLGLSIIFFFLVPVSIQ